MSKDYSIKKAATWDRIRPREACDEVNPTTTTLAAPTNEQYKLELSPAAQETKARITFCIASRHNIVNAYLAIQLGYDYGYEQANLTAAEAILADRKAEHLATYGEDIKLVIRRV